MSDMLEKKMKIKQLYEAGNSFRKIGELLGLSYATVMYHAKSIGVISRQRWHGRTKYTFEINQRINKLLILDKKYNKEKKQYFYQCACDCGNTDWFYKDSLLGGQSQCWECHKLSLSKQFFKGYKDIGLTYWSSLRKHAYDRGYEFSISIEYAWNLFVRQKSKCALSGIDIVFIKTGKGSNTQTASLDRIDSKKGYTEDNIQWVHKDINRMKSNLPEDKFLFYCKKVIEYNESFKKVCKE